MVLTDQREIVSEIVLFFENLYKEGSTGWWAFEEIIWGRIFDERAEWLERPFEEEEIKKTVFGCDREKCPGPDGFTGGFFQDCWDFLKDDIVKVLDEFYHNGKVCGNMNHTFLCLIPQKLDAQKVKDFRPISLVLGLYKILAKLLANRLREVLEETISLAQGAFVHNRQILDVVLVATEAVEDYRKRGKRGVIFKVDFEKAYDLVNWDFLDFVLEKKGFGVRWRSWMRGIGEVKGFKIGREEVVVSHLQFADDTLFLLEPDKSNIKKVNTILKFFGMCSGLKINMNKSSLVGISLANDEVRALASEVGCEKGSWPMKYLGLPLGGNPNSAEFWNPVIEKGRSLVRWKIVCKPKEYGGLGIGNLMLRNKALLGKWLWRFPLEQHSLWAASFFDCLLGNASSFNFEPFRFIWKSSVPHRVKVSAWLIFLGKLNTCDRVQRKNPQMMLSPNMCVMCKKDEETVNHLFLHCCSARLVLYSGSVGFNKNFLLSKKKKEEGIYREALKFTKEAQSIQKELKSIHMTVEQSHTCYKMLI
ncbi:hypothetical protein UlMin_044773 [Ulmus minor]